MILPLLLGAAGAYAAWLVLRSRNAQQHELDEHRLSAQRHATDDLVQGTTYGILTSTSPLAGETDLASIGDRLRRDLSAAGFRVLSVPQLRDPDRSGPTEREWVMTGTWVSATRPFAGFAVPGTGYVHAYALPAQPAR